LMTILLPVLTRGLYAASPTAPGLLTLGGKPWGPGTGEDAEIPTPGLGRYAICKGRVA